MKKINQASDRVRLPSSTVWFPTQLNRALTKRQSLFLDSTIHTDWASKIFPLFLLRIENKTGNRICLEFQERTQNTCNQEKPAISFATKRCQCAFVSA
jgi:hypothetical protein